MANATAGNPWKLDTAAVISTRPVVITKLLWKDPTTDEHDIDCQANDGSEIWTFKAIASGTGITYETDFGAEGQTFSGFNLAVIDSGTLYVYRR